MSVPARKSAVVDPCDVCERTREVTVYDDGHDTVTLCAECDDALRAAWVAMTPEQQAEARREADGDAD